MPRKPKGTKSVPVTIAEPVNAETRYSRDTKDWIRTAADEKAAAAGMVFDGERGEYAVNWMQTNCFLYEGIGAGEPIVLIPYQKEFAMRLFSWVYYSDEWRAYVRRFNWGNLIVAKKNGKTPFLAATGLYLTIADGEPGQKVYTGALNGTQAMLTQRHAISMVEQSPALKAPTCVINKTTGQISHPETRSAMMVLTGDDSRGAKAREGINGSVLFDELHVVDRELAERVRGAGISRREPLNLAVTTAGDDPSSYGFERVEYGRQVNAGSLDDAHFLHVEYAAPQKATDDEIEQNLEEYARAANPAIGYTVRLSEIRQYWHTSKGKPREVNRAKQHRFNIWVGSVSPWLNVANWQKNERAGLREFLRGRTCRLGVDLSRTRDMTSCVFRFTDDSFDPITHQVFPLFWLPRKTAEARKNLFPYLEWAERGDITLTDGNVVDFAVVESDACSFAEEYGLVVENIFFDQVYAEELTQRMSDRLGCERTAVAQSLMTISPLAKELERLNDAGLLEHPGNAVLDWQVGHVQVFTDRNQNIRPVKPNPDSGKSIDGIMALINTFALDVEATGENAPSVTF